MKEINISCYSNKRVRTLIRFFNHIFINSIQPDINMAEEFVDRYIPETKKFILGSTKGNLKNLNNILFVSDNEKRIKEEFEEKRIFEQNRCAMACQGCGAVFTFL